MFGFSTAKLIGFGLAALALIGFLLWVNGLRTERNELRAWQSEVVTATRAAADNPKLGKDGVARQIALLGQSIKDLKAGIANQNAAINAQAAETKRQQEASVVAQKRATQRAERAEATANRLAASSRSGGAQRNSCVPSEALKGAWQ